jgi:hypothetical protein
MADLCAQDPTRLWHPVRMTSAPGAHTPPPARVPRAAFDVIRLAVACVVGINAAVITLVLVLLIRGWEPRADLVAMCVFAFSAASSFAYLFRTLRVFAPLDAARLRALLLASTPSGRIGTLGATLSGTGPTIAVQWSIVAIAAVLTFMLWPGLLSEPTTVLFSILVVVASWAVTVVAYAVHYARYDAKSGGLSFPGKGHDRVLADYLYLAVQVQTTFSTSDVSLLDTRTRRMVTGHTLVSFAFNTVIIAMLITVLFIGR